MAVREGPGGQGVSGEGGREGAGGAPEGKGPGRLLERLGHRALARLAWHGTGRDHRGKFGCPQAESGEDIASGGCVARKGDALKDGV